MHRVPNNEANRNSILRWADVHSDTFCLLNSNNYEDALGSIQWELAIGKRKHFNYEGSFTFDKLIRYYNNSTAKNYGFLSYDLKNEFEKIQSKNKSLIDFPLCFFFEPEHCVYVENNQLCSESIDLSSIIDNQHSNIELKKDSKKIHPHTSKVEYIQNVLSIKNHIKEGDVYELNYCIGFSTNIEESLAELYIRLNSTSPNPFSSVLKFDQKAIISASPERYLCQHSKKMYSQPIKGTLRRSGNDDLEKGTLFNNVKERAENVMIVDLVRNDLTRTAKTGSIKVKELFGIYTFPNLHQMISTIESEIEEGYTLMDVIKTSFPMGSMTGAPKIRAMELIDQYENISRTAYSGSIGYFDRTNMRADFNVLIRSMFIDEKNKLMHYNVGSAITYDSNPEEEYEECLLKAEAIRSLLG